MKDDDKELDEKEKKKILEETKDLQEATSKSNLKVNVKAENGTIPAIILLFRGTDVLR